MAQQVSRFELAIDAVATSIAENLPLIPQGDHKPRLSVGCVPLTPHDPLDIPGGSSCLGIPSNAMESVFQLLLSVHNAQIFCTTYSPVLLGLASPAQLLCFAKTADGQTDAIQGDQHALLRA